MADRDASTMLIFRDVPGMRVQDPILRRAGIDWHIEKVHDLANGTGGLSAVEQAKIGFQDVLIERHSKAPDGMARFRRAAGGIRLDGDAPSGRFVDEWAERWLDQSARD